MTPDQLRYLLTKASGMSLVDTPDDTFLALTLNTLAPKFLELWEAATSVRDGMGMGTASRLGRMEEALNDLEQA